MKEQDHLLCFSCVQACRLGKRPTGRGNEDSFTTKGFKNWQRAIFKFNIHQASEFHINSADFVVNALHRKSVAAQLNAQVSNDQLKARTALLQVFHALRYLGRSGLAIRGDTCESGNLTKLLQENSLSCPELQQWLKRRDNWLSNTIQNEIIEMMAHQVQRELVSEIKRSPFFALMADGTTDLSGDEQFSCAIRHVDTNTLTIRESCLGLVCAPDGTASTLHQIVSNVIVRVGLDKQNVRGHAFDGASAMSGRLSGLQKLLTDDQPKSLFVHCSNHALDLAIQETCKETDHIFNSLMLVKDVSKSIMESSKRKAIYENVVIDPLAGGAGPKRLLTLCPTRWCVRAAALRRFADNYLRIRKTLEVMLEDGACKFTDESKAKLKGYLKKMYKFKTLLSLKIALSICEPAENLAKALQSKSYTATGAQRSAKALWNTYHSMGEDDFNRIWDECEEINSEMDLELEMPVASRPRRPPKRLGEIGNKAPAEEITPRTSLRKKYIETLDRVNIE